MKELVDNKNLKVKYYYVTSRVFGNICTVCLLIDGDEVLARGVAICSLKDAHKKSVGRNIALGRAKKAIVNQETSEEINPARKKLDDKMDKFILVSSSDFNCICQEASLKYYEMNSSHKGSQDAVKISIPLEAPVFETKKLFSYKSEFRPILTFEEKRIVGSKK